MTDAKAISKEISSKLRGYDGLTPGKLAECRAILGALGTTDPQQAHERFVRAVEALPGDRYIDALRCALRLDPLLPGNLTGRSGRRMLFGTTRSVSEETVKTWEARAIETLASALAAQPDERVEAMSVVFYVENERIFCKFETRFWSDKPMFQVNFADDTILRIDKREIVNTGKDGVPGAYYQLQPDEHPHSIDIFVFFPTSQVPDLVVSISALNIFDLNTAGGSCKMIKLGKPRPAELEEVNDIGVIRGRSVVAGELSFWSVSFTDPEPLGIYGITWAYDDHRPRQSLQNSWSACASICSLFRHVALDEARDLGRRRVHIEQLVEPLSRRIIHGIDQVPAAGHFRADNPGVRAA